MEKFIPEMVLEEVEKKKKEYIGRAQGMLRIAFTVLGSFKKIDINMFICFYLCYIFI